MIQMRAKGKTTNIVQIRIDREIRANKQFSKKGNAEKIKGFWNTTIIIASKIKQTITLQDEQQGYSTNRLCTGEVFILRKVSGMQ